MKKQLLVAGLLLCANNLHAAMFSDDTGIDNGLALCLERLMQSNIEDFNINVFNTDESCYEEAEDAAQGYDLAALAQLPTINEADALAEDEEVVLPLSKRERLALKQEMLAMQKLMRHNARQQHRENAASSGRRSSNHQSRQLYGAARHRK